MKIVRYILLVVFAVAAFYACKEDDRFGINSNDKSVPGVPEVDSVKALNGGARVYYKPPKDEKVLQVVSEFTAANGKVFKTTASYFKDSLDVYGMGNTGLNTFYLYSESRSGVISKKIPVTVEPLPSSTSLVYESIRVGEGFNAIYVEWINKLKYSVNVFIDLEFYSKGTKKNIGLVYSSNKDSVRQFIRDLVDLDPNEPVKVRVYVDDVYGNTSEYTDYEKRLLQDIQIPKDNWRLPNSNDSVGNVPMMHGNFQEGRNAYLINGIIDRENDMMDFCHTMDRGYIGLQFFDYPYNTRPVPDRNVWNLLIDLGDYYELSRIVTHQRHSMTSDNLRGHLYQDENVGRYRVYYLDEDDPDGVESVVHGELVKGKWVEIMEYRIPIPLGIQAVEYPRLNALGDEAYMLPITPGFTPATRWFRYQALNGFNSNYTSVRHNCLSEVTLYGRKSDITRN